MSFKRRLQDARDRIQSRVLLAVLAEGAGGVRRYTNAEFLGLLADTAERLGETHWWCRSVGALVNNALPELTAAGWTAAPWHDGRTRGWEFTFTRAK